VAMFSVPALRELTDQQARFAPANRRTEQVARASKLLAEIDPGKQYPYQFVCFRITDFRPESYPDLLISGADLQHDLPLLIEALTVPAEAEPVLTLEQVSKKLNVSTKTIRRWRDLGLTGCRITANGRRQLGFAQSALDRFVATHPERVERGSRFSQLTEAEREEILRRASRLARAGGGTLTEVSRRIARRLGRSTETVRYTIKNHDREHPDQALFPTVTGPLDDETKQTIYGSYRRGIPVETLARRFRRTRTSMYRVINEVRAQRLLALPLDYIYHSSFDDPSMEAAITAPMPGADEYEAKRRGMRAPRDVAPEMAPYYEVPLLNKEQEQHLFRKMNFLKHKASRLRDQLRKGGRPGAELDPARVRNATLDEIERLHEQAGEVKDQLITANMRLVHSIAKKHAAQTDNYWELVSDGNLSLMRAVEKFDFSRGFKFSTYASWAIMKNFARSIPEERTRRERYLTGHEEMFDAKADTRADEHESLASTEQAKRQVNRLLAYLEPREQQIIRLRHGLDGDAMTLEEIGKKLSITKERVRQLNVRIMKKMRDIAQTEHIEMP